MAYPPAVKETTAGITVMDESMRTMSRQSLSVQFGKLSDGQQRNSRLLLAVVFALVGVFAVVFVGGIFSIEFTKETTIKGNRLETVDGEPVEVKIAADSACPLVDLLEKSSAELANEKLVSFSTTDSDGAIWEHTIKIADVASEINLHIFTDPDSRKIRVASFGGGLLRLSKTGRPSGSFFYEGNYMDPYDCVDGCAVSFCDGVNVDEEEDESSHGDVADADGNRLRRLSHKNKPFGINDINVNALSPTPLPTMRVEAPEAAAAAAAAEALAASLNAMNDQDLAKACSHLDVANLNKFQPFQTYFDSARYPKGNHYEGELCATSQWTSIDDAAARMVPGYRIWKGPCKVDKHDKSKNEWIVNLKKGEINSNTKIAGYGLHQDDWKNKHMTCREWYHAIVKNVNGKNCLHFQDVMTKFKEDYEGAMLKKDSKHKPIPGTNCLTRQDDSEIVDKIYLPDWCRNGY